MNFNFDTIKEFDKHISYSIPNYELVNKSIVSMCDFFKDDNYAIYDLGCSTGQLLKSIPFAGKKIGIDKSKNLLPKEDSSIIFLKKDLREIVEFEPSCIILSVFTFVFLPKEIRYCLLQKIYEALKAGGAFIMVEKVYAPNGKIQDIFTFSYYDYKKENFSNEEILNKEKDLRFIQHPNTTKQNYDMLYNVGFTDIFMFYKFYNFEGYLCIK